MSVQSDFPNWVADPCVGLSRVLYRLSKDINGLHSGSINKMYVLQVFDYYEALGVLEVSLTTLPATQPDDHVLTNIFVKEHSGWVGGNVWVQHSAMERTEQVPVNDCYLKNMNMYKYIVNIDIDEVIVPTPETGETWEEMMQELEDVTKNEACA